MMKNIIVSTGFLGTHAPFLSDLTLILILLTAILFTIGWQLARHKRFEVHSWVQTTSACLNAIVVLSVMINIFVVHILPGIPGKLLTGDYAVTTIHALVGMCGLLLGIFVVLRANMQGSTSLRFKNQKRFMQISYVLYMLATLLGVIVYLEVYVLGV